MSNNGDSPVAHLQIYYDSNGTSFWVQNDRDGWMKVTAVDVRRRLKERGHSSTKGEKETVSEVDSLLTSIQESNDVDYAESLAGYSSGLYLINEKRILVRDSPKLLTREYGKWLTLEEMIVNMLGEEQIVYLYGWLKVAVQSIYHLKPRLGQALVLAGPKDCGKSLLQGLITVLFGGRSAKPHRYMIGETPFNSELIGAEHLIIEDEQASTDIRARRNFGSAIKDICANVTQSAHAKHRTAISLTPLRRLSISVNDEPENLMILPPIDSSIQDKLIILKAERHEMPLPTATDAERETFMNRLMKELPCFLDFLFKYEIPKELVSNRYGITHYHHPDILETISAMAPETRLLELIDVQLFDSPAPGPWEGSANQLERILTDQRDSKVKREADRLLTFPLACGTYLGRLQKKCSNRLKHDHTKTGNVWTINPPS
jgi:hypothetical protein